jgi:peptidoglycan/xylan/chitin deacetylase (PgdA/CDA1 family)
VRITKACAGERVQTTAHQVTARVVVFTSNPGFAVRRGILAIERAVPGLEWLVVVDKPVRTVDKLLRSQMRNLRRNGLRWIPYQFADLWQRLTPENAPRAAEQRAPGAQYSVGAFARLPRLRTIVVTDINSAATCQKVAEFQPDLGLSLAAPILKEPLFSLPRLGTLNLHKGALPAYRGMPPAFWELWNGEATIGCTVHRVDAKLDTGEIVAQASVSRERYSTLRGLQFQLDEVGVRLMSTAVQATMNGTGAASLQPSGGRTYRKPTLAQVAALKRKLAPTEARSPVSARRSLVQLAGTLLPPLQRVALQRAMAPRIVVLLYHRVSDGARDNLTVGIEQFDRQMQLLRRFCEPIGIDEVADTRVIARSARPLVCVTFDDGYLDNYEHAAPILLKHRIPGAFFVSTGLISSHTPFPHDVRRGNAGIPTMQWKHLRDMKAEGFYIGSHSVSHIDCAQESMLKVTRELTQSHEDLRRELDIRKTIFAYPYGGRCNMTPERLELVKQAGYVGCLSAYGGTNIGQIDRFNVLRKAIHWQFSDKAFLLECTGLR